MPRPTHGREGEAVIGDEVSTDLAARVDPRSSVLQRLQAQLRGWGVGEGGEWCGEGGRYISTTAPTPTLTMVTHTRVPITAY